MHPKTRIHPENYTRQLRDFFNIKTYLLPETSISLMAKPIQGSINKVVKALIRNDADAEPMPIFSRRTATPASSRI